MSKGTRQNRGREKHWHTNLVKNDPFNVSHKIGASIEHAPQNFGRHYEARRVRTDLHVASDKADIFTCDNRDGRRNRGEEGGGELAFGCANPEKCLYNETLTELVPEIAIFLVAQCFYRTRVYCPGAVLPRKGYGIFGADSLARRGMGGHKDALRPL